MWVECFQLCGSIARPVCDWCAAQRAHLGPRLESTSRYKRRHTVAAAAAAVLKSGRLQRSSSCPAARWPRWLRCFWYLSALSDSKVRIGPVFYFDSIREFRTRSNTRPPAEPISFLLFHFCRLHGFRAHCVHEVSAYLTAWFYTRQLKSLFIVYELNWTAFRELEFANSSVNSPDGIDLHMFRNRVQFSSVYVLWTKFSFDVMLKKKLNDLKRSQPFQLVRNFWTLRGQGLGGIVWATQFSF